MNLSNEREYENLKKDVWGLASTINQNASDISTSNANISKILQNVSNPNLLINGDFKINQRGSSYYSVAGNYTVDRWRLEGGGSVSVNVDGSITVTETSTYGYLVQRIEETASLWGKTITISAMLGNGELLSSTFTLPSSAPESSTNYGSSGWKNGVQIRLYYYSSGYLAFTFDISDSTSATIIYAKLEVGELATKFSPRPYAEELKLCQRYYYQTSGSSGWGILAIAMNNNDKNVFQFVWQFPTTMRTDPTVTKKGSMSINVNNSTLYVVNSLSFQDFSGDKKVIRANISNGPSQGIAGVLQKHGDANQITFDAEIY